mgnify:CR=1 FL=1
MQPLINARRVMLSCLLEGFLWGMAGLLWPLSWRRKRALPAHPQQAEDLDPTQAARIENPYHYYRVLRDQHPLYRPPGQDFYCVSRYHDIQAVARDTRSYSSNIVNVLMSKSLGRQSAPAPGTGSQRNWGVVPVDVLAIQDPPAHKYQKLLTHQIMSHDFVTALEPDVSSLAGQLGDQALQRGEIEFMDEIAWYLPMCMALRLVGFPEADYPQVKRGCAAAIRLLSGTLSASQYMAASARALALVAASVSGASLAMSSARLSTWLCKSGFATASWIRPVRSAVSTSYVRADSTIAVAWPWPTRRASAV